MYNKIMNKNNAKDFLPIVQALAEGKIIQVWDLEEFVDADEIMFGGEPKNYRVKPETLIMYRNNTSGKIITRQEYDNIPFWSLDEWRAVSVTIN